MTDILLVDDHAILRKGLHLLIEEHELPVYERGSDATNTQIQSQLESYGMDGDSVSSALTLVSKKVLGIGASSASISLALLSTWCS